MKKTFFCAMSEFYDNGTVKTAITSRVCNAKPVSTSRRFPGMVAHMDWFGSEAEARDFLAEARSA